MTRVAWTIRGFTGDVGDVRALVALVGEVAREHGAAVQCMRADRLWSVAHLERACALAARAFAERRNRASEIGLEALCYAAGERQIERAIARLGLAPGRGVPIAAVAFGPRGPAALDALLSRTGWRVANVFDAPRGEDVLDALGVGADLRRSVPRERWGGLVLERVALVDLPKP